MTKHFLFSFVAASALAASACGGTPDDLNTTEDTLRIGGKVRVVQTQASPASPRSNEQLRLTLQREVSVLLETESALADIKEQYNLRRQVSRAEQYAVANAHIEAEALIADMMEMLAFLEDMATVELGGAARTADAVGNAVNAYESSNPFVAWMGRMLGTGSKGQQRVTWAAERNSGRDIDGDGFIGRPGRRDTNKNGRCDNDEDCDGDGEPGYCADCGWQTYAIGIPPSFEDTSIVMPGLDQIGFTNIPNVISDRRTDFEQLAGAIYNH